MQIRGLSDFVVPKISSWSLTILAYRRPFYRLPDGDSRRRPDEPVGVDSHFGPAADIQFITAASHSSESFITQGRLLGAVNGTGRGHLLGGRHNILLRGRMTISMGRKREGDRTSTFLRRVKSAARHTSLRRYVGSAFKGKGKRFAPHIFGNDLVGHSANRTSNGSALSPAERRVATILCRKILG